MKKDPIFDKEELENLAIVGKFIRHARNMNMPELSPQKVQIEAMYVAENAFRKAIGEKNYLKIFKTKTWNKK